MAWYFVEQMLISFNSYFRDGSFFGDKELHIVVPNDRPYVDVCVRDFGCEDGDKARLTFNSEIIFNGELYNAPICKKDIPVKEKVNTVKLYAINGTGGKGYCPNNINTGQVFINSCKDCFSQSGGIINWAQTTWGDDKIYAVNELWSQLAGEENTATLNVEFEDTDKQKSN